MYIRTTYSHILHGYCSAIFVVERWRVALKGERPDYINASIVHVSQSTNVPRE